MKEVKDVILKVRLTPVEKEKLRVYAEERSKTMSEVIRDLCYDIFYSKGNELSFTEEEL